MFGLWKNLACHELRQELQRLQSFYSGTTKKKNKKICSSAT
jgi:hypothetical protein